MEKHALFLQNHHLDEAGTAGYRKLNQRISDLLCAVSAVDLVSEHPDDCVCTIYNILILLSSKVDLQLLYSFFISHLFKSRSDIPPGYQFLQVPLQKFRAFLLLLESTLDDLCDNEASCFIF
jgi:hypothetical protein